MACVLSLVLFPGAGCGKKNKTPEAKIYDVYGTVETVDLKSLVIRSKQNEKLEFSLVESSIKGSSFGPGVLVHVYYRVKDQVKEVTMVVEKVD